MLFNMTQRVTLDVKAPSMTSSQMLNSRPPELQSTLGVRTETLDSTLQIQDPLINMFQTINTCFQSFLLVITAPQVHQKSLHQVRQRTSSPLDQATMVASVLPHRKVLRSMVESSLTLLLPEKASALQGLRKQRASLVPYAQPEHTATLARCTWS